MDRRLTWYILGGMILGVIVGQILYSMVDPAVVKESVAPWFKLLSDIFLNLIKLLVAPLVLSTIVVGIAHMGDSSALGRIGFRAIAWFITASFISIGLGLLMVNLPQKRVRGDGHEQYPADPGLLAVRGVALSAIGEKGAAACARPPMRWPK
jgi:Na+/H+-dicarboxylate symporter